MAEHCRNCGSELFVGQRFCRSCGRPTDELSQGEAPTQMMPPQPESRGARGGANTAPSAAPDTSPVYPPATLAYQPTVPPMHPQAVPPYAPPQRRSPLGWILAFLGMGLFIVIVVAVMMIARWGRQKANEFSRMATGPTAVQAGETLLSDAADQIIQSGNDTAFVKSFPLDADAGFSIRNLNGSITIAAWDQPRAEVRAIQKGSDRVVPVAFTSNRQNVSIRTMEKRGNQDIRYEVKLPRRMGKVEINSVNGSVKMSDLAGKITVDGVNGSIELTRVAGVSRVKTVNGRIRTMLQAPSDGPMEFGSVNGSIDVTIKPDFYATLDASAVGGSIDIDDQLGIPVEKQLVGQHARGEIGPGGQPLRISTMSGSIKLTKE